MSINGKQLAKTLATALVVVMCCISRVHGERSRDGAISAPCPDMWEVPSHYPGVAPEHGLTAGVTHNASRTITQGRYLHYAGVGAVVSLPSDSPPFPNDYRPRLVMSAVLITPNRILMANHGVAASAQLSEWVFVTGWFVEYDDKRKPTLKPHPGLRCFPLRPESLVASQPGHLDYTLVEIGKDGANNFPIAYGIKPLPLPTMNLVPKKGDPVHLLGAQEQGNLDYPEGMLLARQLRVVGVNRYTKDLGTNISVDYVGDSWQGLSGGAILDEQGRWLGMHQRNLRRAPCDQATMWHPYIAQYYGSSIPDNLIRPKCVLEGLETVSLPSQGSLIGDILTNIERRKGRSWMCKFAPELLIYVENVSGNYDECDSKRYVQLRLSE